MKAAIDALRRRRRGARGGRVVRLVEAIELTLKMHGAEGREVSLLLTDDREIQTLNKKWRDEDHPTDVLAFALDEAKGPPGPLGDVIISVERARVQAKSRNVTLDSELELLVVHGTLHLLGYDHRRPKEAQLMRVRTRAVRRRLLLARS